MIYKRLKRRPPEFRVSPRFGQVDYSFEPARDQCEINFNVETRIVIQAVNVYTQLWDYGARLT